MNTFERIKQHQESVETWLQQQVRPIASNRYAAEFGTWQEELGRIRHQTEQHDNIRIALVGGTGAGKSTFLNAVLGQELLPVGVMQPCTAFVTRVRQSPDSLYTMAIDFCTRDEWERELDDYAALLEPGEDDDGPELSDARRLIDTTLKRLQAVLGDQVTRDTSIADIRALPLPDQAQRILSGQPQSVTRFDDAASMQKELRTLVRGESNLWPLVKQVAISGPYPCLAGGLELVDLPGVNDPNAARVEVTREYLRSSPFVWVLFPMVRGLTQDIYTLLGEQKLLRTLVLAGTYDALSLIGTKADEIDGDAADQLGLPEDCEQDELIREYCRQTQLAVREQLEQLVRDLAGPGDGGATLERMLDLARKAPIHTVSANAYMRLQRIGRLRKDYGLHDVKDTGIPGVHTLMRRIVAQSGADQRNLMVMQRLKRLVEEVKFFFQSAARAQAPGAEQTRQHIGNELERFQTGLRLAETEAQARLQTLRETFMAQLAPMLQGSVHGVKKTAQGWAGIPWQTLRAIVRRDGLYKSPTTGRTYDLNSDLTEPLLNQLPLTWERYFTDDIGGTTEHYAQAVTQHGRDFADRVRLILELKLGRQPDDAGKQLAWFADKMRLLTQQTQADLKAAVLARRSELANKMPDVASGYMAPAYEQAKAERGPGMKTRMLDALARTAVGAAPPLFESIQADILEGTNDLDVRILGLLSELARAASQQTDAVHHNAGLDTEDGAMPPEIHALLSSAPTPA